MRAGFVADALLEASDLGGDIVFGEAEGLRDFTWRAIFEIEQEQGALQWRRRLDEALQQADVLVALVVPILILGLLVFRMPYDEVAGIVAGACGNPAILAYANKLAPTDRPDLGYAMIFPGMTIVKILFVDIVPAFFGK